MVEDVDKGEGIHVEEQRVYGNFASQICCEPKTTL